MLFIVEGNPLVIALRWRREGDASVFNVVHGKSQPHTLCPAPLQRDARNALGTTGTPE